MRLYKNVLYLPLSLRHLADWRQIHDFLDNLIIMKCIIYSLNQTYFQPDHHPNLGFVSGWDLHRAHSAE